MRATLIAALFVACKGPPTPVDTGEPTPTDTDEPDTDVPVDPPPPPPPPPTPQACSPALALGPSPAYAPTQGALQLVASGGTGAWRYALTSGDGAVGPTGAYLAPVDPGVAVVTLTDDGCLGSATASIEIVPPLSVAPASARVAPGTTFALEIAGGSGVAACALASGAGSLVGCTWTAGAPGVDRIQVVDAHTGELAEVLFEVALGAGFGVRGAGRVAIPVGGTWRPEPTDGTGELALLVDSGPFQVVADGLLATAGGTGQVRVRDRFTNAELAVPVDALAPRVPEAGFYGPRTMEGALVDLGDLDGDGRSEFALGFPELSLGGNLSGGVMVYGSGPSGPLPDPIWMTGGLAANEGLGRALLVHDHDHDGLPDLFVAAPDANEHASTNGMVAIHHGLPGGGFEDDPSWVLSGAVAGDRFGAALALCDFDGDGFDDLAVGAYAAEDRGANPVVQNHGAVRVFRGGPAGFGGFPDLSLFGAVPDGAGWSAIANLNLGLSLTAGDFDDDGLCDLVAGAYTTRWDGDPADHGWVHVYRGTTANGLVLERTPAAIYADTAWNTGQLGRWLAAGDLDGDGVDDLALGQWRAGDIASNGGAVRVFLGGGPWPADPAVPILPDAADWSRAADGGDFFGAEVVIAHGSLWVGAPLGEVPGGTSNTGIVERWDGATIASAPPGHDASSDTPDQVWVGPIVDGYFGQALLPVGDADGDGAPDVVVLAGREEHRGLDVAELWFMGSAAGPVRLELPDEASGHEFGQGLARLDATGDGAPDLVLAGSGDGTLLHGPTTGTLTVFAGGGAAPTAHPLEHAGRSGGDRLGAALARLDFDGDGSDDLAVAVRNESKPANWNAISDPHGCPAGALSGSGAVWIYDGAPLADTPRFVTYGGAANENVQELAVGDFDGDGISDLAFSSTRHGGGGGFSILAGRAPTAGPLEVLCDATRWSTAEAGANLGPIAAVPDLDGDGCDELAAGAPNQELGGANNRGVVWLLWGHGPDCASETPEVSVLVGAIGALTAGGALAAGDVDGDGVADLVVGGWNRQVAGAGVGAVWLVPGTWLVDAPRTPATAGLPASPATRLLTPTVGPPRVVNGRVPGGRFGEAVALVPDPVAPGRLAIAVASPRGQVGGGPWAGGGVEIYRWDAATGLGPEPWGLLVAEPTPGELGERLVGERSLGAPALLVGAPTSDAQGLDQGAAYVWELP